MTKKRLIKFAKWFSGIVLGLFLLITLILYIYKDEICQMAVSELNKHLKTKVSVSQVDLSFWSTFPNLSVDFNDVFILDAFEDADERDTLLYSDRLRFKFDPWEIWEENYTIKSIEMDPGVILLKVNDTGTVNYDIFKAVEDTSIQEQVDLHLNDITLKDVRFRYTNAQSGQDHYTRIKKMKLSGDLSNRVFTARAKSDLFILQSGSKNLALVKNKSATLDVAVQVNTDSSTVVIPSSIINIEELPFRFEGKVDSTSYHFGLKGENILIQEAANKLAFKETGEVKRFSGSGELLFDLEVKGSLITDDPAVVECNFGIENGQLREPETGVALTSLKLDGHYSNEGGAEKEALDLKEVSFKTVGGLFKGTLHISDFEKPLYRGSADGLINLGVVHSLFRLPYISKISGNADMRTDFRVRSIPDENGSTGFDIEKLEGKLKMNGVDVRIEDDRRFYEKITGTGYLKNDEIGLEQLSLKVGSSDLMINGVFSSLKNYLSKRGPLDVNVELNSRVIDLRDLATESKENKMTQERAFVLPDDLGGKVYLYIGDLRQEGHTYKKVAGNMIMNQRMIHFPRIVLNTGGSDVTGSLTIEERRPEIFQISFQALSQNIDLKKLFREWNNFDQDVITSDNISGLAMANVTMEAPFDLRSGVIPNAIKAQIGVQVNDGRLQNVTAFREITESMKSTTSVRLMLGKENIESFGRKLNDLKFKQLNNTLIIENSVITMPSMSIQSSALDLEASGTHTFEDKIDYRFGFRFRDLKKKETSEFGEIVDDETGKYIFMRMYGDLDNPKFEWDSETNREKRKQEIKEEKEDIKSILKSEFGLYKNDTTVKRYIEVKKEHETIEVITDPEMMDTLYEHKKPRKDSKLNRYLDKLKQESEGEKKEEVSIDE